MIRVVTPCRLHFGLFHVPASPSDPHRSFGGVGMMIDGPRVAVRVEGAEEWAADGPSSGRALKYAQLAARHRWPKQRRPVRITVEECPPEHVGLGVGTQLGLAVADAVSRLLGGASCTPLHLSRQVGRGERSGIGVHGYRHGGLVVDAGKKASTRDRPATIAGRYGVPPQWRIVLIRPHRAGSWHGEKERSAFAHPRDPGAAERTTERLCRLALLGLVPAAVEGDFDTFSDSLYDFNRLAGEAFVADQGGVYSTPQVAGLIDTLRTWGVRGVGQSSWGPTVFAFVDSQDHGNELVEKVRGEVHDVEEVQLTKPAGRGAMVFEDGKLLYGSHDELNQPDEQHVGREDEE